MSNVPPFILTEIHGIPFYKIMTETHLQYLLSEHF